MFVHSFIINASIKNLSCILPTQLESWKYPYDKLLTSFPLYTIFFLLYFDTTIVPLSLSTVNKLMCTRKIYTINCGVYPSFSSSYGRLNKIIILCVFCDRAEHTPLIRYYLQIKCLKSFSR